MATLEAAHISLIRQAFTAFGANLPKPVTKAMSERDKIIAGARELSAPGGVQVGDALAACILEDRDPLADDRVRTMMLAHAFGNAGGQLAYMAGAAADRRIVAAFRASVDAILDTLADHADHAGQQLADAFAILGDRDLSDAETVLRLGPDAARAWAEAREAEKNLILIDRAWIALATLTGFASSTAEGSLRLADLDLERLENVGRNGKGWDIVRAGGRIELANATTIRERTARIVAERQDREATRANAPRVAYRRLHAGVGG